MNKIDKKDSQTLGGAARKPYKRPKLEVYGDIRQITQNRGTGQLDSGGRNRGTHTGGGPK